MFPLYLEALGFTGTAVEVGVAEGNYAADFLRNWPGQYVMVDRWQHIDGYDDVMNGPDEEHEERFRQAMQVASRYAERCKVYRMDSVTAADRFADHSLDFVYLDGDHSLAGCYRDIVAWCRRCGTAGFLPGTTTTTKNRSWSARRSTVR